MYSKVVKYCNESRVNSFVHCNKKIDQPNPSKGLWVSPNYFWTLPTMTWILLKNCKDSWRSSEEILRIFSEIFLEIWNSKATTACLTNWWMCRQIRLQDSENSICSRTVRKWNIKVAIPFERWLLQRSFLVFFDNLLQENKSLKYKQEYWLIFKTQNLFYLPVKNLTTGVAMSSSEHGPSSNLPSLGMFKVNH